MNVKRSILSGGFAAAAVVAFVLFPSTSTLSPMPILLADSLKCDMTQYKATKGLTAAVEQDMLVVTWTGQAGSEVRARYAVRERPASGSRPGGPETGWPVGHARAESHPGISRGERSAPDVQRPRRVAARRRHRIDTGGGGQEPVVRLP